MNEKYEKMGIYGFILVAGFIFYYYNDRLINDKTQFIVANGNGENQIQLSKAEADASTTSGQPKAKAKAEAKTKPKSETVLFEHETMFGAHQVTRHQRKNNS